MILKGDLHNENCLALEDVLEELENKTSSCQDSLEQFVHVQAFH